MAKRPSTSEEGVEQSEERRAKQPGDKQRVECRSARQALTTDQTEGFDQPETPSRGRWSTIGQEQKVPHSREFTSSQGDMKQRALCLSVAHQMAIPTPLKNNHFLHNCRKTEANILLFYKTLQEKKIPAIFLVFMTFKMCFSFIFTSPYRCTRTEAYLEGDIGT